MVLTGLVHRAAATNPWADDRILAGEPVWFQQAAPWMHAALPAGVSVPSILLAVVDPLTAATHRGDVRALAAVLAAATAGALWRALRLSKVPVSIAAVLACTPAMGSLLPVAAEVSAAHALIMACCAVLLWISHPAIVPRVWGPLLMAAVTFVGIATHVAFAGLAIPVWLVLVRRLRRPLLWSAASAGVVALGLVVAAFLVSTLVRGTVDPGSSPGTLQVFGGFLTGRFPPDRQPQQGAGVGIIAGALPGAPVVSAVLLVLAIVVPGRRADAGVSVGAISGLALFLWRTWVADPAVAAGAVTVAATLTCGLTLAWLWREGTLGARALAVVCAVLTALSGAVRPVSRAVPADSRTLMAFARSMSSLPVPVSWVPERLSVDRALLADPSMRPGRRPAEPAALAGSRESVVVVFPESARRLAARGVRTGRFELPFPSGEIFVRSLERGSWLAFALRDDRGGLALLAGELTPEPGVPATSARSRIASLQLLGAPAVRMASAAKLLVPFGGRIGEASAPAAFELETEPHARIAINGETIVQSPDGGVLVVFDPWIGQFDSWVIDGANEMPAIRDVRLQPSIVLGGYRGADPVADAVPDGPATPLADGAAWFGRGWHGPEDGPAGPFRWTSEHAADVHVLFRRAEAVRVRFHAALAGPHRDGDALAVQWNGRHIQRPAPWPEPRQVEWVLDGPDVRHGWNTLTVSVSRLVSPAVEGLGTDARMLGAAIAGMTFESVHAR
jgi:hypothetical protein